MTIAVAWTFYNIYITEEKWGLKEVINIFGPSFFLLSWITGQLFRVKKQTKVDSDLKTIESRIASLVDTLEDQTTELSNYSSGGDSFVYFAPTIVTTSGFPASLWVFHKGKYPIYDLSFHIKDLDEFEAEWNKPVETRNILGVGVNMHLGNVSPNSASATRISINEKAHTRLHIQFSARNGHFSEILHIRKVGTGYKTAIRVSKLDTSNTILFEEVDNGYPLNEKGEVDW